MAKAPVAAPLVAPLPGTETGAWVWFLQPVLERTLMGTLGEPTAVIPDVTQPHQ